MAPNLQEEHSVLELASNQDSWVAQHEPTFSNKLLVVAGSISSFAGFFPLFLSELNIYFETNVSLFFKFFTIFYFTTPLVIFLLWMKYSKRIASQKPLSFKRFIYNKELFRKRKKLSISHRFWIILWTHVLLVCTYVFITFQNQAINHELRATWGAILLLIAPVLAILTYKKRYYPHKKVTLPILYTGFVLFIIGTIIYLNHPNNSLSAIPSKSTIESAVKSTDYELIGEADNVANLYNHTKSKYEKTTSNFYEISNLEYYSPTNSINYNDIRFSPTVLNAEFKNNHITVNQNLLVDSLLGTLTNILFTAKTSWLISPNQPNQYFNCLLYCKEIGHKHFTKDQLDLLLNADSVHHNMFVNKEVSIINVMRRINPVLEQLMSDNRNKYYSACLFSTIQGMDKLKAENAALTLNVLNSKKLKEWTNEIYLPYCHQKMQQEVGQILQKASWIWQDLKFAGIVISLSSLLILFLFQLEMKDYKSYKKHLEIQKLDEAIIDESNLGDQIKNIDSTTNYILYPQTIITSVITVLFVATSMQPSKPNLEANKSFKIANLPSSGIIKSIKYNLSSTEENDEELKKSINNLTISINNLTQSYKQPYGQGSNPFLLNKVKINTDTIIKAQQQVNALLNDVDKQLQLMQSDVHEIKKIKPIKTK